MTDTLASALYLAAVAETVTALAVPEMFMPEPARESWMVDAAIELGGHVAEVRLAVLDPDYRPRPQHVVTGTFSFE